MFWDVQQMLLEDVDRIEVIGGPAGTIWGANAVNGVINIITKRASETPGGLVAVAGNDPTTAELRYGAALAGGDARGYVRHYAYGPRDHAQGGFRWDHELDDARVTVQGDIYRGTTDGLFRGPFTLGTLPATVPGTIEVSGYNVIAGWTRVDADGDELRVRGFVDHTYRDLPGTFIEDRDTLDVELQQSLAPRGRHRWTWGVGARHSRDETGATDFARFEPAARAATTAHAFAQDVLGVTDELSVALGAKVEHNDFTGFEFQPQARASWRFANDQVLWGAVSRAVRVPSRLDHDLTVTAPLELPGLPLPLYVVVTGDETFDAEDLVAYELGYRLRVAARWTLDATLYHHDYDGLQVTAAGAPTVVEGAYIRLDATLANGMDGTGDGAVVAANFSPAPNLRFQYHFSYLDLDLRNRPGFGGNGPDLAGNSPRTRHALRAFWDVGDFSLYAAWRRVDELPNAGSPGYDAGDVTVRWSPSGRVEVSLMATDLGGGHVEFAGYRVEPAVAERIAWHF